MKPVHFKKFFKFHAPTIVLTVYFTVLIIAFTPKKLDIKPAEVSNHPAWSEQSNIYEVNVRQYTPEGTFKAFEPNLERLKKMGVDILWFMPITPIGLEGRKADETQLGSYYAVRDYKAVNPEFGTMEDWKELVKHAHSMGFKVIADWVGNHSSPDNNWIKVHPDFYAKDSAGNFISPFDWTDTRKLNFANLELRDSMIDAMKYWLKESDIDGFRCDVASGPPADFWKQCIDSLKKIKNVFMLAEGESPELHKAGFDETYTWSVMEGFVQYCAGKITLPQVDSIINHDMNTFPKNSYRMYFTTNHDWNSWEGTEFERFGDANKPLTVFAQTMYQSVPLIYSGQEVPNKKRIHFFVKDTISWDKYDMAPMYSTLLHLRKSDPALAADASYKKLATGNDNAIFAYEREKEGHKIVVILNLSNQPQRFTINESSITGNPLNIFLGVKEKVNTTHVFSMEQWGYIVYEY